MKSTIALLMILLVSCDSPQIKPVMGCDITFGGDKRTARCRCRLYDLEAQKSVQEPINYPIEHCEGIFGFYLEDIAQEIKPKVNAKIRQCEDSQWGF